MSTIDEVKTDEVLETSHDSYTEFEKNQLVVNMAKGSKIEILVNGILIKEYTAKYVNCHANVVIQDKGDKIVE